MNKKKRRSTKRGGKREIIRGKKNKLGKNKRVVRAKYDCYFLASFLFRFKPWPGKALYMSFICHLFTHKCSTNTNAEQWKGEIGGVGGRKEEEKERKEEKKRGLRRLSCSSSCL